MNWGKEWITSQYGKFNTEPTEWPTDKIENYKLTDPMQEPPGLDKLQPKTPWINPVTPEEQLKVEEAIVEWPIKCQDDPKGDIDFGLMKLEKVYNNLSPTHDPYTNPNSHIYYQCKCGDILDPGTKSFAALNNCASEKGWKVRWSKDGQGYEPFCVECGEGVE